jgi:hypothetical protein
MTHCTKASESARLIVVGHANARIGVPGGRRASRGPPLISAAAGAWPPGSVSASPHRQSSPAAVCCDEQCSKHAATAGRAGRSTGPAADSGRSGARGFVVNSAVSTAAGGRSYLRREYRRRPCNRCCGTDAWYCAGVRAVLPAALPAIVSLGGLDSWLHAQAWQGGLRGTVGIPCATADLWN